MLTIDNNAFHKAIGMAHIVGWNVSDDDALSFIMSGSTKNGKDREVEEMLMIGFYIMARDGICSDIKKLSK